MLLAQAAADPGFDLATYYPLFLYLAAVVAFVVSRPWSQAELSADAHSETDTARDEDPIRHAWTFVIPPTAEQFAARKER